jgi:Co/Zn/Cd efflux system component
MDCPSEEHMIRMSLDGRPGLIKIEFDLPQREIIIYHEGNPERFLKILEPLNFGCQIISSDSIEDYIEISDQQESKVLKILLAINATMFLIEIIIGWLAESAGLIADSLDMFADATVYSLSLYAVGKAIHLKKRVAKISGYFQLVLAIGVLFEVFRRFIFGSNPEPPFMMGIASLALVANVSCLFLLFRHRKGGEHMRASWIFSTNDVIANLGVILAGGLVALFKSNIPDLIIGLIISIVVIRGAIKILDMSKQPQL